MANQPCAAPRPTGRTTTGATDDGDWPGLAAALTLGTDPDALAAEALSGTGPAEALLGSSSWLKDPRLALVPARRSADIPAAIG